MLQVALTGAPSRSFAGSLAVPYLTAALAVCAGLFALSRRARDADLPLYVLAGVALWYCLLRGGINADIAGVVTAMALPAPPVTGSTDSETILDRMHHSLTPWTSLLVMPVFALANTAVPLASSSLAAFLSAPVAQGIALGLVVGKPLGIVAFSLVRGVPKANSACLARRCPLFVFGAFRGAYRRVLAAGH